MDESYFTNQDLLPICIKDLEKKFKSKESICGVPSGITDIDRVKLGFRKQELTILTSRPGFGKTSLALSMASNISQSGKKVLYLSFEMSEINLMARIISQTAKINNQNIDTGHLKPSDFNAIMVAAEKIYTSNNIYFKTLHNKTIRDLYNYIKNALERFNTDIVFIDYLTMIKPENQYQNRWEQVAEISRSLKQFAMEFSIPIIALCPINRQSLGKTPSISDLSESGSLEYDADCIMIINQYDDRAINLEKSLIVKEIEVNIAKNRNGPIGCVRAVYFPSFGLITSTDAEVKSKRK